MGRPRLVAPRRATRRIADSRVPKLKNIAKIQTVINLRVRPTLGSEKWMAQNLDLSAFY